MTPLTGGAYDPPGQSPHSNARGVVRKPRSTTPPPAVTPGVPFVQDSDFTLYVGDVRDCLRELPDESVHTVVTSPPYWGLRDYGTEGQIGLEATPDLFVASMVAVFREVRRVLRADGTLWLNLGDSYYAAGWESRRRNEVGAGSFAPEDRRSHTGVVDGLKVKDLVGIPWRVAFALQADGWYLRSDVIWAKPNPMPESVTDRPTKAHEYVFLLSKSPRYFFDQEAVREKYQDGPGLTGGAYSPPGQSPHGNARGPDGRRNTRVLGADGSIQHRDGERWPNGGRNVRSVWEIATQPYPDAHFATFPEALPERCIRAGTSERGCCPVCGAPWEREVERGADPNYVPLSEREPHGMTQPGNAAVKHGSFGAGRPRSDVGWRPSCEHVDLAPVPAVCLDPFMGSGTTALVARNLGRRSVGIELNPEYAQLAARRLQQLSLLAEPA